jgi:23S rRNA (adenine2030-N6)-methyltransferase
MNYRHAFHAGNFADLVKHAALLSVLHRLQARGGPVSVLDTHAGAGRYDLDEAMARRSGEGEAARALLADASTPAVFEPLKAAIRALNPRGGVRIYPGSPLLAARALGRGDSWTGCEMRPDDHEALQKAIGAARGEASMRALKADGYAEARRFGGPGPRLLLVDPPFERADEYGQTAETAAAFWRRAPDGCALIWLPLKDLETFDGFLRRLEDLDAPDTLVVECRLQPLENPMRMNGCALVIVRPPAGAEPDLSDAAGWTAMTLGQTGAEARVWRLDG